MKVPVTVAAESIVTMHVPVPVQPPPDQPANLDPVSGSPVSLTSVPIPIAWEQSEPQSMPIGLETMSPLPLPASATVKVSGNCAHEIGAAPVFPTVTETGVEAIPFTITRSSDGSRGMPAGSAKLVHETAPGAIDRFVIPDVRAYVTVPVTLSVICTSG